jgi:hypothetical protein
MNSQKLPIAVAGLSTVLTFGTATKAADLPKQGTFKGTFSSYGTVKTTKIGDLTLTMFDETGPQVTDGFGDHVAFHCWGIGEAANGTMANHGYCVGTDPGGDTFSLKFSGNQTSRDKAMKGTAAFGSGTGKYRGISGGVQYVVHALEFRPPSEGTYVNYVTLEGNYKLP